MNYYCEICDELRLVYYYCEICDELRLVYCYCEICEIYDDLRLV